MSPHHQRAARHVWAFKICSSWFTKCRGGCGPISRTTWPLGSYSVYLPLWQFSGAAVFQFQHPWNHISSAWSPTLEARLVVPPSAVSAALIWTCCSVRLCGSVKSGPEEPEQSRAPQVPLFICRWKFSAPLLRMLGNSEPETAVKTLTLCRECGPTCGPGPQWCLDTFFFDSIFEDLTVIAETLSQNQNRLHPLSGSACSFTISPPNSICWERVCSERL